jgi:HK97 gp10 family phage protein
MANERLEHVKGLSEMLGELRSLPIKLRKEAIGEATRDAAKVVRDDAKQRVHTYTGQVQRGHPPPGTLKKEVIYKRIGEQCTVEREVYFVLNRRSKSRAYYWRWVEFGTSKMVGQAFFRKAFEGSWLGAIEAFRRRLQVKLQEIGK